jgi:hypothetical protein
MHISRFGDTIFLHDGDHDGTVIIRRTTDAAAQDKAVGEVTVPEEDIRAYVAMQVRRNLIEQIEGMSDDQILTGIGAP